jgi:hypothetical protein
MGLTADDPATAAQGRDYVRAGELSPKLAAAADEIECRAWALA